MADQEKSNPQGEGGDSLTLENKIQERVGGEAIDFENYLNLLLDGFNIGQGFKAADREYLNKFKNLQKLSVNNNGLKFLDHFPETGLLKLEISDNQVKDEELSKIVALYKDSLVSLKACNNQISSLDAVLEMVKGLPKLVKLDLTDNAVCKVEGYREKVLAANSALEVLDLQTRQGEEVDDSSMDDYGEEGEADLFDFANDEVLENLDPETREKYLKGELNIDEMKALGLIDDQFGDYGEEGELEFDDEEGEEEEEGNKK